ncbi:coiled-coil domain-containing protein 81-like [Gallus gallus]|uniref:coiled-coil domain-containing protein 81-like n=1 Tax=Gallus gallus TaxID=9031 RepID=UPI0003506DC4|nr:coiled-coil domain-containing protein 81-like [Gallus gallus]XP_046793015.1 coiled-coil domain-containing protein 81-like [Gallus gallus]
MVAGVFRYLLFKPLDPKQLSLLKELSTLEICRVWETTSKYIQGQLLEKRAVDIGIGSFAVVSARAAAGEDGVLVVDKPIFQLNQHVQEFYEIKEPKTKIPSEMFEYPLDFQEIAKNSYFRVPIVERCIHETLLFFAEAIRGKKEVDFFFKRLGILSLRGQEVIMNFFDDCVLQLDATGNMLPALLGDPEMMNMIAFKGKNKFTRRSEDGCIIIPKIGVEGSKTSREITSLKPRRESQPWGGGARRVSVYDPVVLARRRASQAVREERKQKEQEKKKQGVRVRFLSQLEQAHAEDLKQLKPPDQPKPSASAKQPSRMAARLMRAQIEEKRLQVLMASKRKEVEAEIQRQYQECTHRLSSERSQYPFHRLLEGDPRPSYIVRREYDQQLGERLKGKDGCQSPAGQTAPKGWQNKPQLPGTSREQKGEKMRLLDHHGETQGL